MLRARRVGAWSGRYDLTRDGRRVATWNRWIRHPGGSLELDGSCYVVRSDLSRGTCTLVAPGGALVAQAHRVGRRNWTVEAEGTSYDFRRASIWRQQEDLCVDGRRVGTVRRTRPWSGDAVADLPGLPLTVEAFALAVVLITWDIDAAV